jgi:hypothetical protein
LFSVVDVADRIGTLPRRLLTPSSGEAMTSYWTSGRNAGTSGSALRVMKRLLSEDTIMINVFNV